MSIKDIYPLIVPSYYYNKNIWELPHYRFPCQEFMLTWVTFKNEGAMLYLNQTDLDDLNNTHPNWEAQAFENLRVSIGKNENFFSQYKLGSDGKRIIFIAFLNKDGIGSSRILLSYELSRAFPNGYYLAFPDRSCGLIVAKDATFKELSEIKKMVAKMYKDATTAMSAVLHPVKEFKLPLEWLKPLDSEFSNTITGEIIKLKI